MHKFRRVRLDDGLRERFLPIDADGSPGTSCGHAPGYGVVRSSALDGPMRNQRGDLRSGPTEPTDVARRTLRETWLCFAEGDELQPGRSLQNVGYLLQEGLKQCVAFGESGHIGDAGARCPPVASETLRNSFSGSFVERALPRQIYFDSARRVSPVGT